MSELFDSLNFPSTGLTSSQSSQPTTSRVYWHASPSPALLSTRNGTPSRPREHESPTMPPLCTQAFLGELRKVSSMSKPGPAQSASAARHPSLLDSPASPKARGKRRAEAQVLDMGSGNISDDDDDDDDADIGARGKVLFLGEIIDSSPETRRRRTMDAGHTGRLRKPSASPLPQAKNSAESSKLGSRGGSGSNSADGKAMNPYAKRLDATRDPSTSSASARRLLRRSRGSSKRHNPIWINGLGINTTESPLSILNPPQLAAAMDESSDGQRPPQSARKLFEDLNAVLEENYKAVLRKQAGAEGTEAEQGAASQPCSAPLAPANKVNREPPDVEMTYDSRAQSAEPCRTGIARSISVPNHANAALESDANTRKTLPSESGKPTDPALGGRRTLTAVRSHNNVFDSDRSEAAHRQREEQVRQFAAAATHARASARPSSKENPKVPAVRPLSSRSNLPPRAQSNAVAMPPIKAVQNDARGGVQNQNHAPTSPTKRSARIEARRYLGTRQQAGLPPQSQLQTMSSSTPWRCDAVGRGRSTSSEVVDLTMDDEVLAHADLSSSTSPRKSRTPSPTKSRTPSNGAPATTAATTAAGAHTATGASAVSRTKSTSKTSLGMGKISSSCLSQVRQPGLSRSSQSLAASQRSKRASTATNGVNCSGIGSRAHQAVAAAQRSKSSPSAPFRPPARTNPPPKAAAAAAATGTTTAQPAKGQERSRRAQAHIPSDDSFGLSDTDDAAFATLASELGF
ncbi:hypothetical protein ACQY0O_000504 [Thecaphora frezii]